ncbi:trihelix transcription factor GT-2-like [Cynara cardunculus var. scolymus]|uniref:trihelix transcription factor GT-2-like n=1 Tax=Cynara cardunculus var. scolymus TaxID=59895 RepID=UPI000D624F5D|nr:trihelix transcription factor GT-2-like [Cynara cardunculus var. scolymus]
MEGVPATIGSSGDDGLSAQAQQQPAQAQAQAHVNGGGGGGDDGGSIAGEEGDRNSGGNRWPKQETLALIKIRSDMDAAFRDSNLKGPLWDDVSRKLSELGFHRSAKKCREKFENVYKYHRRTKEGRTSKSDKTYRFFDQLQALEASPRGAFPPPLAAVKPPPIFMGMSNNATTHPLPVTVPSFNLTGSDQNNVSPISVAAPAGMVVPPLPAMNHKRSFPFPQPNMSGSTNSDESYTSSDEEPPRKKRKWQEFFGKLMNEVIEKQEELQMKFLDTLDRRERDRVAREEAWRAQEIAKMNQEHERLVKERSIAAAKDAAVVTFLQKMTGKTPDVGAFPTIQQHQHQQQQQQIQKSPPPHHQVLPPVAVAIPVSGPPPPQTAIPVAPPTIQAAPQTIPSVAQPMVKNLGGGGGESMLLPSPSRWPKAEINALISLRTQLDIKYQENVPKGPLWEDISAAMRKLGYNRNAKRCKEKWENINKYYKKMKEGNKKRPEDSKTCPYFHQLDAIYSEKANNNSETKMTAIVARPEQQWPPAATVAVQEKAPTPQQQPSTDAVYMDKSANNLAFTVKPETQITPVAAWPQQQWLLPTAVQETPRQPPQQQLSTAGADDQGSGNDDDYDDDEDEDEDEDEDGGDEIVPNKMSSMAAV